MRGGGFGFSHPSFSPPSLCRALIFTASSLPLPVAIDPVRTRVTCDTSLHCRLHQTRAPRPSPGSLPPLLQPPVHCHCRAVTALTLPPAPIVPAQLSSFSHLHPELPLHCSRPHCQFSSPVPLAQLTLPCHSSPSATEPCLSYYRACASHSQ